MRIPRRGEVGWQGEEIERLEELGYVMSGRNKEGGREGGRGLSSTSLTYLLVVMFLAPCALE